MKLAILLYILIMILLIIIKPKFIYDRKNKIEQKKLFIIGICIAIICSVVFKKKDK